MGIANYDAETASLFLLADAMSGGNPSRAIESMEADGQRQLVNSDRLPSEIHGGTQADFEAVGFVFGPVDKHDTLFRQVTLPVGWRREGTEHAMHSNVVDQLGRKRVGVFCTAAFYDRRADMALVTPYGYLSHFIWDDDETALPICDDEWLTPERADEVLAEIRGEYLEKAAGWDQICAEPQRTADNVAACRKHQADDRARGDTAEALRVRLGEFIGTRDGA